MHISRILSYAGFAGALLLVSGLCFSPAMQSIGVALIFLHPFLNRQFSAVKENLRKLPPVLLIAYYLLNILSFFYSDNTDQYWRDIQMKVPFLLLPIGLAGFSYIGKQWRLIMTVFVLSVFVSAAGTLGDYLMNYSFYNEQFIHSKSVPVITGVFHIYFGVLLAFASIIVLYAIYKNLFSVNWQRYAAWFVAIVLLICLHTVSARTGLLAFYAALFVTLVWYIIKTKRILIGLGLSAAAVIGFFVAVNFVPALKQKLENTKTDIERYRTGGDINYYSISTRLAALDNALEIYKQHPTFGVGPADLEAEVKKQYQLDNTNLVEENRKNPHHQFMETMVTLGMPAFLLLCLFFVVSFLNGSAIQNLLFLLFLVIVFVSFQVESMLERQVGIIFFCFFYLGLPKQYLLKKDI